MTLRGPRDHESQSQNTAVRRPGSCRTRKPTVRSWPIAGLHDSLKPPVHLSANRRKQTYCFIHLGRRPRMKRCDRAGREQRFAGIQLQIPIRAG